MPPRKGVAAVKRPSKDAKFIFVDSDSDEVSPPSSGNNNDKISRKSRPGKEHGHAYNLEHVDPTRMQLNLSNAPEDAHRQPRQDTATVGREQSKTLATALFPPAVDFEAFATSQHVEPPTLRPATPPRQLKPKKKERPVKEPRSCIQNTSTQNLHPDPNNGDLQHHNTQANKSPSPLIIEVRDGSPDLNMIQGGAYIPTAQQRNMRACMVCSIVRTQQQFMSGGCPNCEEVLELAGNSEQINDCTSQVFEGLITVMDTKRSWVARYQRLEGYVAGVYATQVEGILPEDVIQAVENAGINYVPRDGSEQDMLPKD